jgi:hypothetical protein
MIYRRRRGRSGLPSGFYRLEGAGRKPVFGFGDGDYIRLRDEFGNIWRGCAEMQGDETIRYRFRDGSGKVITGIADGSGIVLRDESGNWWRGFID